MFEQGSTGPDKDTFESKLCLFSYPPVKICVFGAKKNRLIKTRQFFLDPTTYVLVEK